MDPVYEYVARYRKWASDNPTTITDIETFLRGLSYLLPGYFKESVLISEFVYSLAQLISLLNRRLVKGNITFSLDNFRRLEDILRVLNCVEVFLELAAGRLGGPVAKWTLIFSLQVLKTVVRLILLFKSKQILRPIEVEEKPEETLNLSSPPQEINHNEAANYFTLKSTGRVIRKVHGAPPIYRRSWLPPTTTKSNKLTVNQFAAEILHVLQPLVHLTALGLFGDKSWAPFVLALGVDCTSQGLHMHSEQNAIERKEIVRRWFGLLNYILRSPFYDKKSKWMIMSFLSLLEKNLPFGSSLMTSMKTYLPEYQSVYFYTWSQH